MPKNLLQFKSTLLEMIEQLDEVMKTANKPGRTIPSKEVMVITQVAAFLSVSVRTIERRKKAGKIAFTQMGRISYFLQIDIIAYMQENQSAILPQP